MHAPRSAPCRRRQAWWNPGAVPWRGLSQGRSHGRSPKLCWKQAHRTSWPAGVCMCVCVCVPVSVAVRGGCGTIGRSGGGRRCRCGGQGPGAGGGVPTCRRLYALLVTYSAVSHCGSVAGRATAAAGSPWHTGSQVTGHGSRVMGHGSRVTGHGSRVTGSRVTAGHQQ